MQYLKMILNEEVYTEFQKTITALKSKRLIKRSITNSLTKNRENHKAEIQNN